MTTEKSLYAKGRAAAMCMAIAIVSVISIRPITAQTEATIFRFTVADGVRPWGGLIADSADNLYGATTMSGPAKYGTVFELSPPASGGAWTFTILYAFQGGADGQYSIGPLVMDKSGNLYGTTSDEGPNGLGIVGFGTVYEVSPPALAGGPWTKTTLHSFQGPDGETPAGGLVIDDAGNLYGTTWRGGEYGDGTAFEVSPPATSGAAWTEKVIYSFVGLNGENPAAGMAMDQDGALYGGTVYGGATYGGTVYQLVPPAGGRPDWMEKVLYTFTGGASDGFNPVGGMVLYRGNLYGAALDGALSGCDQYQNPGCGTIFELSPPTTPGGTWSETSLYDFDGGADGGNPNWNVLFDREGNLYTTASDGGNAGCGSEWGCGAVIKLAPPAAAGDPWTETTLYDFSTGADGGVDPSGLVFGKSGRIYGTTFSGGDPDCTFGGIQCGVVFSIIP
jgi:uncharacterized repeat protein (TIGR03803 family)